MESKYGNVILFLLVAILFVLIIYYSAQITSAGILDNVKDRSKLRVQELLVDLEKEKLFDLIEQKMDINTKDVGFCHRTNNLFMNLSHGTLH